MSVSGYGEVQKTTEGGFPGFGRWFHDIHDDRSLTLFRIIGRRAESCKYSEARVHGLCLVGDPTWDTKPPSASDSSNHTRLIQNPEKQTTIMHEGKIKSGCFPFHQITQKAS